MGWWDGMGLTPSVGRSGMGDVQIIWSKVGVKGRVGIADVGAMDMFVWPILVIFEPPSVLLDAGGRFLITSRRSFSDADIIVVWWRQNKVGVRPDSCLLLAIVLGTCVWEASTVAHPSWSSPAPWMYSPSIPSPRVIFDAVKRMTGVNSSNLGGDMGSVDTGDTHIGRRGFVMVRLYFVKSTPNSYYPHKSLVGPSITPESEFYQKTLHKPRHQSLNLRCLALRNHIFGNTQPAKLPTKQAPIHHRDPDRHRPTQRVREPFSPSRRVHQDNTTVPPYTLQNMQVQPAHTESPLPRVSIRTLEIRTRITTPALWWDVPVTRPGIGYEREGVGGGDPEDEL